MRWRRPYRVSQLDWNGRSLAALATISFAFGIVGFRIYLGPEAGALEILYQTLQLFFLNFDRVNGAQMNFWLELARFLAFVTAVWAIVKAFFPQARYQLQRMMLIRGASCAVILGYGPVGQVIGGALRQRNPRIKQVTAVHPAVTADLAARARADGVFLVEGDPSDPKLLRHLYVGKADVIYVSGPDDLYAIDTAVAVRRHLRDRAKDIRIILNDNLVASQIAEATATGFLGPPNIRWFSVGDETARQLISDARFDRFALESGASRMHLVIVGCGSQGDAVAVEALLTAWRRSLGPPKITFVDRDIASVEARMRKRIPAWFAEADGAALYPAARPAFEFLECDVGTVDFARAPCFDGLRERVSGWVFATGDDSLNLRASIELHRATVARLFEPAPIYVGIQTGHVEGTPDISANLVGIAHTFGGIESVLTRSALLTQNPDAVPRILHEAYRAAEQEMFGRQSEDWESLPETKREANRALFRHAVMKIEDFGAVATIGDDGIPETHPHLAGVLRRIDESLSYDRIDAGQDPSVWLKDGAALSQDDLAIAVLIRDSALCEHSRWTIERALSQFVPTALPDRALRDDVRRFHNNMHDWFDLDDAETRRYDVVMLRVLLSQRRDSGQLLHKAVRVRTMFLSINGTAKTCSVNIAGSEGASFADVSELHLHLNARDELKIPSDFVDEVMTCLVPHIDPQRCVPPVRIRFDFPRHPSEGLLSLANLVADALRKKVPDTTRIDAFWNWRAASPVVGVVGHRNLSAFGGESIVTKWLLQCFMDLVMQRGSGTLVTGYAPGSDRAAVQAWASLGLPKPLIVFPFTGHDAEKRRVWFTEDPATSTDETMVEGEAAKLIGTPMLPSAGEGHRAQADEVLKRADVTVFVVDDDDGEVLAGGTRETLQRARDARSEILVLSPQNRSGRGVR